MAFKIVKELARVPKKGSSFYVFNEVSVNGKPAIDFRVHFERIDGSTQHTTKGDTIPLDRFADVMAGFRDVHELIRDRLPRE